MDMRIPKTNLQLLIVCERAGRAIPLARISDSTLVATAARSAIAAAAARADEIAKADMVLGAIERAEAHRLSEVLGALLPGISRVPRIM
jgi:hypothetical protein